MTSIKVAIVTGFIGQYEITCGLYWVGEGDDIQWLLVQGQHIIGSHGRSVSEHAKTHGAYEGNEDFCNKLQRDVDAILCQKTQSVYSTLGSAEDLPNQQATICAQVMGW